MGEIRDRRRWSQALQATARDAEAAQRHVESAGDLLIKQLVQKQTRTHTSLQEQLNISQNFVHGCHDAVTSAQSHADVSILTIEDLKKKTGLSRENLEELLSVKPNSTVSRLYKFALSNQSKSIRPDLISLLPDHPLNQLKLLEQDLMRDVTLNKEVKDEEVISKRKRKKHRTRKKKASVEQSCEPPSLEKQNLGNAQNKTYLVPENVPDYESKGSTSCSTLYNEVRPKRRSLWDVKDMKAYKRTCPVGCEQKRVYTIRNGEIIQVMEGSETDSDHLANQFV